MSKVPDNLDDVLRAVLAGKLDALTPEQVALLAHVIDREPAIAARLATRVPIAEPALTAGLDTLNDALAPSPVAWQRVWDNIDRSAANSFGAAQRRSVVYRFWKPVALAAACLLLAVTWQFATPQPADPWPLRLATNVDISDVEAYDGATPFLFSTGGANAIQVIWVLEPEEG